jgi:hypothetical protein
LPIYPIFLVSGTSTLYQGANITGQMTVLLTKIPELLVEVPVFLLKVPELLVKTTTFLAKVPEFPDISISGKGTSILRQVPIFLAKVLYQYFKPQV